MKVYIGADHRGFNLKDKLKGWLIKNNVSVTDLGAYEFNKDDDYPIFADKVAHSVASDVENNKQARGILICGSGVGVDIVANKFKHLRSGLAVNPEQVKKARFDDDINILAIPSDFVNGKEARKIVKIFLKTPFSKEDRKIRRLSEIREIENEK